MVTQFKWIRSISEQMHDSCLSLLDVIFDVKMLLNQMQQRRLHAAVITQRYEQFWYKPIPHDFEKLILNQRSFNDIKWLNLC